MYFINVSLVYKKMPIEPKPTTEDIDKTIGTRRTVYVRTSEGIQSGYIRGRETGGKYLFFDYSKNYDVGVRPDQIIAVDRLPKQEQEQYSTQRYEPVASSREGVIY